MIGKMLSIVPSFFPPVCRARLGVKYRVFLLLLLSYYIDGRGETTLCAKKKSKMEEGERMHG